MAADTFGHLLALHVTPTDVGDWAVVGRLAADIQDVAVNDFELSRAFFNTRSLAGLLRR
jgi:hypothetical protein